MLICGLGSIGRRHLRHFRHLGVPRIDAYRTGRSTAPAGADEPEPDTTYGDLDEALAAAPDVVVVANPTSLHLPTARAAVRAGADVLIEKPLADALDGVRELEDEVAAAQAVVAVACNLRFHPLLRALKDCLADPGELGAPVAARVHFGTYMPDWHPWEDYRTSYAARADLGGGAALTHIHEIDYTLWLLGPCTDVRALALRNGPLGTDVDEASAFVLRHASGALSSVTLSLVERPPTRRVEISFERGAASLDLLGGTLVIRGSDGPAREVTLPPGYDIDQTYEAQAKAFMRARAIRAMPEVTLADAVAALEISLEAVRDFRSGI